MDKENNQKTFSEILADEMRSARYSVDKLSKETGISERFIMFLLEGRIEDLPPTPYVYGYMMRIGEVLGIDAEKLWKEMQKEAKMREAGASDKLPPNRFVTRHINALAVFGAVLLLGTAVYFLSKSITAANIANALRLYSLEGGTTVVSTSSIVVSGSVERSVKLTINESPVYPDENGAFSRAVELKPGMNAISFELKGFLGRTGKIIKHVFYKPNEERKQGQGEERPGY